MKTPVRLITIVLGLVAVAAAFNLFIQPVKPIDSTSQQIVKSESNDSQASTTESVAVEPAPSNSNMTNAEPLVTENTDVSPNTEVVSNNEPVAENVAEPIDEPIDDVEPTLTAKIDDPTSQNAQANQSNQQLDGAEAIVVPQNYPVTDAAAYFIPKEQRRSGNLGGPPPMNFPGGPSNASPATPSAPSQ